MRNEVQKANKSLQNGQIILYPTDTIWGIGCDAANAEAIARIYEIKKRDPNKSMLILAADLNMVERYVAELPEIAEQLFELTDKPLTLVLENAKNLASNLPAADGSIGIRIPDDPFCQDLLSAFRRPIVSTSANFSGEASAQCFDEISEELKKRVDHIVDWRQEEGPGNQSSSVVFVKENGEIKILRS